MTKIRLPKLPERTPIKLTISVLPELSQKLVEYAAFYQRTYGADEPVSELVPAMLESFLTSDKAFALFKRGNEASGVG